VWWIKKNWMNNEVLFKMRKDKVRIDRTENLLIVFQMAPIQKAILIHGQQSVQWRTLMQHH
ncbi:MAG: hypothetical protein VW277_03350, partial [Candidatus Neomarinimicrobiota bacterium]